MKRNLWIVVAILLVSCSNVRPSQLTCEYQTSPLIDVQAPRLSWKNSSCREGAAQTAYQIRVMKHSAIEDIVVWDSGKVESENSLYIRYAGELPVLQAASAPGTGGGTQDNEAKGLRRAVVKGLCREAGRLACAALENGRDGLELVQQEIIPALDEVGQGFEAKRLFLPQLMMSAEAAEAAFREIKERTAGQAGIAC